MKTRWLLLLACVSVLSAAKHVARDWKVGSVVETAFAQQDLGTLAQGSVMSFPGAGPYAPNIAMGNGAALRLQATWQGFVITGSEYVFMVATRITTKRKPDVAIHGQVRYAMDKGNFYLLDDSGHEFKMVVLKKRVADQPGEKF
jgi:hypothetical protein